MFYVYMLRCSDASLYVGHSADIEARMKEHEDGVGCAYTAGASLAQSPVLVGAQFDVISIKLNTSGTMGGGGRELPDGTRIFTNRTIASIVAGAAREPVFEVVGLPDWTKTEHYDIQAKPVPDSHPTHEQRAEMMRNLFFDRMKLVAHIEERKRDGFALVVARSDGKLGP